MRKFFPLFFGILCFLPMSAWGTDLFVQSNSAPVLKTPGLNGIKVMELAQGTKVIGIKREGMWQQIQYQKKTGWIYTLMLGPNPPLRPHEITSDQMDQISESARKRPSAYASTAAARGLMNQRKRLGQKLSYDFEALEKMESYAADTDETLKFIKERDDQ